MFQLRQIEAPLRQIAEQYKRMIDTMWAKISSQNPLRCWLLESEFSETSPRETPPESIR
jgi:hypothetical protein